MPSRRPSRRKLIMLIILAVFLLPILARAAFYAAGNDPRSWRDADWSSTGLLPPAPQDNRRASSCSPARPAPGRACSRCIVGSCSSAPAPKSGRATTWSAGVRRCARTTGRRTAAGTATCRSAIADISGPQAERLIPKIEKAVADYNFAQAGDYRVWPGPNSNSFTAAVLRAVPELHRGAAAQCRGPRLPRRALCRHDRQPHRRRAQSVRARRHQDRLGRRRRDRPARPGRRASICAIPASSCPATATSAWNRRSPPRWRASYSPMH